MFKFINKNQSIAVYCLIVPFYASIVAAVEPCAAEPIATAQLGAYVGDAQNRRLGCFEILNPNEFVTTKPGLLGTSSIDIWRLQSGQIETHIVPPEPVEATSLQVSPDARRLIATQAVLGDRKHKVYDPHKLFVWSAQTKHLLRTIDFGLRIHIDGVVFWPGQPQQAIIQARPISSNQNLLLHVNLNTGKFGKLMGYPAAKYLLHSFSGYNVFSPDGKLLASVEEMGEGFAGSIDIVELKTGKILSHYAADFGQAPVFGAAFFLSNTRFFFGSWPVVDPVSPVYAGYSYDFTAKKISLRVDARLRCLAGVPSRPGYGFFISSKGLELWNIPKQQRLRRWPLLTDVEQIALSPDQKIVGFYYEPKQPEGESIPHQPFHTVAQFWSLNLAELP